MYTFSKRSNDYLLTVRPDLVLVAQYVMNLQVMDFAIVCGHRDEEAQTQAFLLGNSTKQWPHSSHNMKLSNAFDFVPWVPILPNGTMGIPWHDTHAFAILGGMFLAAGAVLDTTIRYGGDWDRDGSTQDQRFMDWGHIEVIRI